MPAGSHPKLSAAPGDLNLPERFEILRPLGEGGMGMVFEAFDHERKAHVALKTLKRLASRKQGAQALLRFKREFRALQDLHHRNLVSPGGAHRRGRPVVFHDGARRGARSALLRAPATARWRRRGWPCSSPARRAYSSSVDDPPMQFLRMPSQRGHDRAATLDEVRLRSALPQLASGLEALHAAGKVHRDIKPSNIRVTPAGRVVLLDFGLVADVSERPSIDGDVAGTPAYMAPEQVTRKRGGARRRLVRARRAPLRGADRRAARSTGRRSQVLMNKQREMPPPPPHAVARASRPTSTRSA